MSDSEPIYKRLSGCINLYDRYTIIDKSFYKTPLYLKKMCKNNILKRHLSLRGIANLFIFKTVYCQGNKTF